MGFPVKFPVIPALLVLLLSGASSAQCQLAFNEQQDEVVDIETLLDLSLFDDIDPATEVFTDFPVCDLGLLETYAYSLFATGEYDLQSRIYTYILRHDRNFLVMYNLACCYSRLGQADRALEFLEHSFRYGYDDLDWVEQDTDMDIVRSLPGYEELMARQYEQRAVREAGQGTRIYVECPSLQACQVVLPEYFDPEAGHTLVLGLHGAGDSVDRFATLPDYFGEHDFIYAALQGPFPDGANGGAVWFGGLPAGDAELDLQSREQLIEYVDNAIDRLEGMYLIDSVYLIGFSQGAFVSYLAGINRSDAIDGIVVFGGRLFTEWFTAEELSAADGLRVFIAHGSEDEIGNPEEARDMLTAAGCDVTFREFQGGHFIHLDTLHEAVEWMRQ